MDDRSQLLRATLLVANTPRFIRHRWGDIHGDIKEVGIIDPQPVVARIKSKEYRRLRVTVTLVGHHVPDPPAAWYPGSRSIRKVEVVIESARRARKFTSAAPA